MDKFDSVFAGQMDDDTEFDTIFGGMEDGELIDIACGFNEAGECETDFDELHQTADDATPEDFEDEIGGEETDNTPDDVEGGEITFDPDDESEDEADAVAEDFDIIHQTEDDAEPKDIEKQVTGPESKDIPKDAEGTDDEPVADFQANTESTMAMAFGEDFDIIHQTEDDATAKDLEKEVVGKETDNAPKDAEGTDDDPVADLQANTEATMAMAFGEDVDFEELHQTADGACEKSLTKDVVGQDTKNAPKDAEGTDDEPVVDLQADADRKVFEPDEEDILGDIEKLEEEADQHNDGIPGTDESDGEITDGENAENEGLPEETMDEMMERLFEEAEEDEEEVDLGYEDGDELLVDTITDTDEE